MLKPFLLSTLAIAAQLVSASASEIVVIDAEGKPVPQFEVMVHTHQHGYVSWKGGSDGKAELEHLPGSPEAPAYEVIVRATGYATAMTRFVGDAVRKLQRNEAVITLPRGREVVLKLRTAPGVQVPEDCLPQTWFPDFAGRVQPLWQPENQRHGPHDFNMLNLTRTGEGEYSFRLPDAPSEFYVSIFHPGFLRFFQAGPFDAASIAGDELVIELPAPAAIEVSFDRGAAEDALLADAACRLFWKIPGRGSSVLSAASQKGLLNGGRLHVADLTPGEYMVDLRTIPGEGVQPAAGSEVNPGAYSDRRTVIAAAGKTESVVMRYAAFDPEAWRGERSADVRILSQDGSPAAGRRAAITWFDGHYGMLPVFDGPVPSDGTIRLRGVTDRFFEDIPFGPYTVSLDDKSLAFFRIQGDGPHEFEFRLSPEAGDLAPNIALTDVETGGVGRLHDHRGKVVLLEFWATWCGPCQPAMEKLNELAARRTADWKDRVVIVPLSVDDRADLAADHAARSGWTALNHVWAGDHAGASSSPAEAAFVVHGIPTAVLIGPDGRILWRGHPLQSPDGQSLEARISAALRNK